MNPPPVVPAPPPTGAGPAIHLHTSPSKTPAAPAASRGKSPSVVARHPGPVAAAGVGVTGLVAAGMAIPFGIAGAAGGVAGVALATAGGVATHRRLQRDPSKPRPPRAPRTGGLFQRRQRTETARTVTSTTGRPAATPRGGRAGGLNPGPAPQRRGLARLLPASRRSPSGGPGSGQGGGSRPGGATSGSNRRRGPFGLGRRSNPSGATPGARPPGSGPQGAPPARPARSWRHPFRRTQTAPSRRQPAGQAPAGAGTPTGGRQARSGPLSPAARRGRNPFRRHVPATGQTPAQNGTHKPGGKGRLIGGFARPADGAAPVRRWPRPLRPGSRAAQAAARRTPQTPVTTPRPGAAARQAAHDAAQTGAGFAARRIAAAKARRAARQAAERAGLVDVGAGPENRGNSGLGRSVNRRFGRAGGFHVDQPANTPPPAAAVAKKGKKKPAGKSRPEPGRGSWVMDGDPGPDPVGAALGAAFDAVDGRHATRRPPARPAAAPPVGEWDDNQPARAARPAARRRADLGDSQWTDERTTTVGKFDAKPEHAFEGSDGSAFLRRLTYGNKTDAQISRGAGMSGEITNQGGAFAAALARMDAATEEYAQYLQRIADEVGDGPNAQAVKDYAAERARQAHGLVGAGAELLSLSRQADASSHAAREENVGRPNPQAWFEAD